MFVVRFLTWKMKYVFIATKAVETSFLVFPLGGFIE